MKTRREYLAEYIYTTCPGKPLDDDQTPPRAIFDATVYLFYAQKIRHPSSRGDDDQAINSSSPPHVPRDPADEAAVSSDHPRNVYYYYFIIIVIIIIIIAHRAFLAAAVTIYNSGSGKRATSVYMYICILYGFVVRWRRVVVIVRAVEYFMLNPRTAFVKNAPSASRGGVNLSVKFEMIERFVSEVTRCVFGLLM
ncbi:unnamed protein product [Aphis gossypii]|uniref:Uncharacterized protein n=1 Tax=Aphis gossypii TaxID=80765 RepID=A0A9P0J9S2_APHGO|nr:unnamed protein product [Aphis gossypii]